MKILKFDCILIFQCRRYMLAVKITDKNSSEREFLRTTAESIYCEHNYPHYDYDEAFTLTKMEKSLLRKPLYSV